MVLPRSTCRNPSSAGIGEGPAACSELLVPDERGGARSEGGTAVAGPPSSPGAVWASPAPVDGSEVGPAPTPCVPSSSPGTGMTGSVDTATDRRRGVAARVGAGTGTEVVPPVVAVVSTDAGGVATTGAEGSIPPPLAITSSSTVAAAATVAGSVAPCGASMTRRLRRRVDGCVDVSTVSSGSSSWCSGSALISSMSLGSSRNSSTAYRPPSSSSAITRQSSALARALSIARGVFSHALSCFTSLARLASSSVQVTEMVFSSSRRCPFHVTRVIVYSVSQSRWPPRRAMARMSWAAIRISPPLVSLCPLRLLVVTYSGVT